MFAVIFFILGLTKQFWALIEVKPKRLINNKSEGIKGILHCLWGWVENKIIQKSIGLLVVNNLICQANNPIGRKTLSLQELKGIAYFSKAT